MQLRFVGCGDAFGSGGRLNTCFHFSGREANFLIDCGASALPALALELEVAREFEAAVGHEIAGGQEQAEGHGNREA